GGADRGGRACVDGLGQLHQPVSLEPRLAGEATPVRFADTPAVQYDPVARREAGMAARGDDAGAVDAGNHRPLAHHRTAVGDGEPVLEVDRGLLYIEIDVGIAGVRDEIGFVELADAGREAGGI